MEKAFIFLILIGINCQLCFGGDIITLAKKKAFIGKVTKIKKCNIHFKANKQKYIIPASDILTIQFEDAENKIYKNYLKSIALNNNDACLQGTIDGENHGKGAKHIIFGFSFGLLGVIGAAISNPMPGLSGVKVSESNELYYDSAYLECYKKAAKKKNIRMSAIGTGVSAVLTLAVLMFQQQ